MFAPFIEAFLRVDMISRPSLITSSPSPMISLRAYTNPLSSWIRCMRKLDFVDGDNGHPFFRVTASGLEHRFQRILLG